MGFFANGQKSLVPIGGNFFATPDTPADPRDCDRYPNSPYCGGGFLDVTPIRIIPQIVADECNFGVAIQGTLGFVRLPTLQIVHRNPNCQSPPLPKLPVLPRNGQNSPKGGIYCEQGVYVEIVAIQDYLEYPGSRDYHTVVTTTPGSIIYPLIDGTALPGRAGTMADFSMNITFNTNVKNNANPENSSNDTSKWKILFNTKTNQGASIYVSGTINSFYGYPRVALQFIDAATYESKQIPIHILDNSYPEHIDIQTTIWQLLFICGDINFIDPPPPPPPKMPECCPGQANNDALLKLILKRIGTLPTTVLTSHLTKNGVQPAQTKQIESLVDFTAWFAERFDEAMGEFEITIEVKDADLAREGDQTQTIRLPNLGEAIAELFSLSIHSKMTNDLILNIVNRNLIESGQIKQTEFKTFSALYALIDYIGCHLNTASEKMPLTFKPGELAFDKFLKEGEIDVSVLRYTEKDTLAATMHTLLQAAAIIRAVHFKKTPGNEQQIANTIKNDLTEFLGEHGSLSDQVKTFLKKVEKVYDGNDKPN